MRFAKNDVQFIFQCQVVFREQIRKIEVRVQDAMMPCVLPWDVDGRFDILEPFQIDGDEVVAGDGDAADILLVAFEISLDELSQFVRIFCVVIDVTALLDSLGNQIFNELEFFGSMVGRRHIPVEVILIENFHDSIEWNKTNLVRIERA